MRKALITGINGQDGSYLTTFLMEKGYEVHGTMKRNSVSENQTSRLNEVFPSLRENLHYADMTDMASLIKILNRIKPDEIYNLAAQSHVRVSFEQPIYTAQATALGVLNLLEAVKEVCPHAKIYQASSSEMFGNSIDEDGYQRETTPFKPVSPYGCSKVFAHNISVNYRNSYNMFISCGILFNHESPRRGVEFVTRKITHAVANIKLGKQKYLTLGNIYSKRDWGHAKDYVRAMWLILQKPKPEDYVIGTGKQYSVLEFVKIAFQSVNLNYKNFLKIDIKLERPAEVDSLLADNSKAKKKLKWKPEIKFEEMVKEMVLADIKNIK
jgi:GDPmannose 4,6-dehydratase